ncbi:MAG: site-specific recombinase XerD [Colwellia polaris]|jgi:site-specific recombinase XerD
MKKVKLENYEYHSCQIPNLEVIIDDEGVLVHLVLLYSIHLTRTNDAYSIVRREDQTGFTTLLESSKVGDSTITTYMACLFRFCKFVNESKSSKSLPCVHRIYELDSSDINIYINKVLSLDLGEQSLELHVAALTSFFNFLTFIGIKSPCNIGLSSSGREQARDLHSKIMKINYVTLKERFELIKLCTSKRDRLIMKMGYEVGLRASENRGILLSYKGEEKGYLQDLFNQLNSPEFAHRQEFRYYLPGKYAKRGIGRFLYFTRELLNQMKQYYDSEREAILLGMGIDRIESKHLFINEKGKSKGKCISRRLASDRYSIYASKVPELAGNSVYHDLRHTFATQLYHDELLDANGAETRSESAALIVVAERLGHQRTRDGKPSSVTTRYIRLRNTMLTAEDWN